MKINPTVKDLIEVLQTMDENLPICELNYVDDEPEFLPFEICKLFNDVEYYQEDLELNKLIKKRGNVVALY